MELVPLVLLVLGSALALIGFGLSIPYFLCYRQTRNENGVLGSDEESLRSRHSTSHTPTESLTKRRPAFDQRAIHLQEVSNQADGVDVSEPPTGIVVIGREKTVTLWLANRGLGEGYCIDDEFGRYYIMRDLPPSDGSVQGGILLHDASDDQKEELKLSGKPVLVESEDPVRDDTWEDNWAPSLSYPLGSLLAKIHERPIEEVESL
ncbi:hypothetical protein FSARC_14165 [Fusarium sarcochroum]|uniref:Uncharacterized protein n=1 Tax=Fusarium sarcochroum TaxID=1208366 RepID=A0A8H4WQJ0_9HYPO|nr:hypothetical protein FSARC_14165 [Fusarium sarcochroum]